MTISVLSAVPAKINDSTSITFDSDALGIDGLFVIRMPDDSMSGTIECGDALLVRPFYDGDNFWDGVYLYEFRGHRQCRRLQIAGDKLRIIPDNKFYETIELNKEERKKTKIKILGMVSYHCQIKRIG